MFLGEVDVFAVADGFFVEDAEVVYVVFYDETGGCVGVECLKDVEAGVDNG